MEPIKNTDLLINPDGSIYHLCLKPEQLADTVIVVGDPDRVPEISYYFDLVDSVVRNLEFVTHTGICNRKPVTVLSTGIGTDNIDIVMNELDALANVNLVTRRLLPGHRSLDIIRIGTSGAIQPDIPVNSIALSTFGLGLDNLLHFYEGEKTLEEADIEQAFIRHTSWNHMLSRPYFVRASDRLLKRFDAGTVRGITATAPGFYGPQGRVIRLALSDPRMIEKIMTFRFGEERIINFEMETSALYGLGRLMGHETITVCALIANRITNEYCIEYKPVIKRLVEMVLERIAHD